ncbi:hypothetical protein [Uliginosibacterium gangwonense]|uniref:hypothetical protein n=1 Tax=Uliginosibacterium gangwonense TaxID=392736 RepID=UPI0012F957C1|nr:hypothetical protein [Uliginosibacterium gangwonense]
MKLTLFVELFFRARIKSCSMYRLFHILLVGLLVLALPLQGVSAAVMAMSMERGTASMAQETVEPEHMASCHDMDMAQADHGMAASHAPGGHIDHMPAKLKVCGTCCIGVMFGTSAGVQVPAPLGATAYLSLNLIEPLGFIPDGLERPPRSNS